MLFDPNCVKVVRGGDARALYFSRAPIPYLRDIPRARWSAVHDYWGHIGIYAFRREILNAYDALPHSDLEAAEKLEQLRWLAGRWSITTAQVKSRLPEINTRLDLKTAQPHQTMVETKIENELSAVGSRFTLHSSIPKLRRTLDVTPQ